MMKILDLVAQVAASRATILITGETGTGKELIANAIHAHSARSEHPFVPVHSGPVPPDLLESMLFGHVKGAFTGAVASRKGYFEIAKQGHHFLDEIGTISLETQTKLLRVIQEREFMLLGLDRKDSRGCGIVAATDQRSEEGRRGREVSRRPVLSAECDQPPCLPMRTPQGRYSGAWWTIFS